MGEIKNLLEEDQKNIELLRQGKISEEEFKKINKHISKSFFDIFKNKGFPCKNTSNEEGYGAGIILTLHQPLENIKIIYEEIKNKKGCVENKDEAFIVDKIRIQEGKKQKYGTQYKIVEGKIEFLPIEDEAKVNNLRAEIGLESIEEYKRKAEGNI